MIRSEPKERITTTYDMPTEAWLVVKTKTGQEWPVTQEDLDKFNLVDRLDAYTAVCRALEAAGMTEPVGRHSALRYLIERTLAYSDLPMEPDNEEDAPVIENVRRNLERWEEWDDD